MPTTYHIFISVRALTPKLNPSAPAAVSKQTRDPNHAYSLTNFA